MKQRLKAVFKGPMVFPAAICCFSILALYGHDMAELELSGTIVPHAVVLVFWGTAFIRVVPPV